MLRFILILLLVIIIVRFLSRIVHYLVARLQGRHGYGPPQQRARRSSRSEQYRDIRDAEFEDLPDDEENSNKAK